MDKRRRLTRAKKKNSSFLSIFKSVELPDNEFSLHYNIERPSIGEGSFGRIFKAYKKEETDLSDENAVAVKQLDKSKMKEKDFIQVEEEVNALEKLSHSYIIRFLSTYDTTDYYYIVMEFVVGSDLSNYLLDNGPMSEDHAKKCVYQIIAALSYCKKEGVVHRDIKPANVLITGDITEDPLIKLIDFGLCAIVDLKVQSTDEIHLNDWVGTLTYASPEILLQEEYNFKTDMWSLGVLTYEILAGKKPFKYEKNKRYARKRFIKKIVNGKFSLGGKEWKKVTMSAKRFIFSLMQVDVDNRMTPKEAKQHPWLAHITKNTRQSIFAIKGTEATKSKAMRQNILDKFEKVCTFKDALAYLKDELGDSDEDEEENNI